MKQNQNQHQQGKNQPAGKDTGSAGMNKQQQRTDFNKPNMNTQTPNRPGQPTANQGGKGFGGGQKPQAGYGGDKNKDGSHR